MLLTERYKDKIDGVLACFDRIVIHCNIPVLCFDGGMTSYLISKQHHKGEMKVVINTKMRLAEVVKGELEKEYSQLYLL